ncbi:extracellular solute-binding protein [Paenibacillus algorifonticola]|uniref:ABC transporter substrate-binding protein n=1 Tax=Paenibacillus algorifonticola TaxID=684063 RepID=UPI003D2CD8F8
MKKMWVVLALLVLVIGIYLAFGQTKQQGASPEASPTKPAEKISLSFWTYYGGWEDTIKAFNDLHPEVAIKVTEVTYADQVEKYTEALASGSVPDVIMLDSAAFPNFGDSDKLENLLDAPYNAGEYKAGFSQSLWDSNLSFDGKRLIGWPLSSSPKVTYYREDILKKYGFPTDPEKLATYMDEPDNWVKMNNTLQNKGVRITQWYGETINLFASAQRTGLVNDNHQFAFNNDTFEQAIALTQRLKEHVPGVNIWEESGEQAVRDGKLAMVYLGIWGDSVLEQWAPETAGKWRQTRLPLKLNGWENSSVFLLPSGGKHKEMAWAFMNYVVTDHAKYGLGNAVPAYGPVLSKSSQKPEPSTFLGGQIVYPLNVELASKMHERKYTALDNDAQKLWNEQLAKGMEKGWKPKTILNQAEKEINRSLADLAGKAVTTAPAADAADNASTDAAAVSEGASSAPAKP